ncbi:MAG: 30S ribosomal protein S6 [Chloroflexi bacterium]|nr:30S ribosomal protein S6 [Chloroflexota bacterium]
MRSYELIFIVHPDVDGDGLTAVIDRITELVKRDGGKVVQTEPWGMRRLAYPILKRWEGQYVLMRLELAPQGVSALERGLGLMEQVIRHLVVRVEQVAPAPEPAPEPKPTPEPESKPEEEAQPSEAMVE